MTTIEKVLGNDSMDTVQIATETAKISDSRQAKVWLKKLDNYPNIDWDDFWLTNCYAKLGKLLRADIIVRQKVGKRFLYKRIFPANTCLICGKGIFDYVITICPNCESGEY